MGMAWPIAKDDPSGISMIADRPKGIGRAEWYGVIYDLQRVMSKPSSQIYLLPFMIFESCVRTRNPYYFPERRGKFQSLNRGHLRVCKTSYNFHAAANPRFVIDNHHLSSPSSIPDSPTFS